MSEEKVTRVSKKKVIVLAGCILFILALLGYRISANFQTPEIAEEVPVNVRIAAADMMSIYTTSPISGRIQPIDEVIIMPLASGEVTRVHVKMGDEVKKGDPLFEIDRTQAATAVNQASAAVNQAREVLNASQAAYERMQLLYNEGAMSLQAFEQAQTSYITSRESFNAASAALSAASNALSNTTVTAPIDGYVTSLLVSIGSLASPGAAAAVIADVSSLKIDTSVSEYLVPRLHVGDPVEIRIATLGEHVYTGIITAISPAPAAGGLTYPVSISVNNDSGEVMAGMFTEISIVSDERDLAVCIPSDAVIIKSGAPIAVVIGAENIPEFRNVTTGIDNGEYVEIVSGLSAGEIIVISGQHFVQEGSAVNIVD